MAEWHGKDYFLFSYDFTRSLGPVIYLNLDFADADFTNQFLDDVDLRFAWLARANFTGSSLKYSQFDFSYIAATNYSNAKLVGASLTMASYHSLHPPIGLSRELMQHYEVHADDGIPFE